VAFFFISNLANLKVLIMRQCHTASTSPKAGHPGTEEKPQDTAAKISSLDFSLKQFTGRNKFISKNKATPLQKRVTI
jgi:hypothetical protein